MKTNIEFKRYIRGDLSLKKEIWFYSDEGYKGWWLNGKRHREDGPAIERSDGSKEWWLEGCWYQEEKEYWEALEKYKREKNIK